MPFYKPGSGGCKGGARGGAGPPSLFWVKKEEVTEGRKAAWANITVHPKIS